MSLKQSNNNHPKEKCCGCIIIEDGKVLLVQHVAGHWGFPKGHVEQNETEEETAIREVKEETNIDVEIQKDKRYTMEYVTDKGIEKEVVFFIAKKVGGEIKPQEGEINMIKWLDFQEAIEIMQYDNIKTLFKQVLKTEKGEMNIKTKAILFDLDHTILDTKTAEYNAICDFKKRFNEFNKIEEKEFVQLWDKISTKLYDEYLKGNISFEQQRIKRIQEIFEKVNIKVEDDDAKEKFKIYLDLYEANWILFDDAIEVLEKLKEKYKLAIVTNGDSKQQREKIANTGIEKYFSEVIISSEVGIAKPDKKILKIACEKLNLKPEECIMVGDKFKVDVQCGLNCGMKSIWVNRENKDIEYEYQIKQLKDVFEYIEPEIWDLYDENRKIIGSMYRKNVDSIKQGQYHIAVEAIIMNSKNEILISQRAKHKIEPFKWECTGGSILIGETSLQGMIREIKEELGIILDPKEAILLKTIQSDNKHYFKDIWVLKKEVNIEEITFPDKEAIAAKWVSMNEIEKMKSEGKLVGIITEIEEYYETIKNLKPREACSYIGKEVTVKVDRPLGSKHPKHNMVYPVNYGYIPGTTSGDGEELDCYILGVESSVNEFKGICIAVIYRLNDNEDKLIIAPKGKNYTDKEIRKQIEFQEKYFVSEIIR